VTRLFEAGADAMVARLAGGERPDDENWVILRFLTGNRAVEAAETGDPQSALRWYRALEEVVARCPREVAFDFETRRLEVAAHLRQRRVPGAPTVQELADDAIRAIAGETDLRAEDVERSIAAWQAAEPVELDAIRSLRHVAWVLHAVTPIEPKLGDGDAEQRLAGWFAVRAQLP
jgi:hypothetical protein